MGRNQRLTLSGLSLVLSLAIHYGCVPPDIRFVPGEPEYTVLPGESKDVRNPIPPIVFPARIYQVVQQGPMGGTSATRSRSSPSPPAFLSLPSCLRKDSQQGSWLQLHRRTGWTPCSARRFHTSTKLPALRISPSVHVSEILS